VFVDGDDFLLVGGEFFCVALYYISFLFLSFESLGLDSKKDGLKVRLRWEDGGQVPLKQQAQHVSCSLFPRLHSPA
jgi:hypothetical protein